MTFLLQNQARFIGITCASIALATSGHSQTPSAIAGQWRGDDGKAIITIAPCGSEQMCGRIARVLVAQPAGGARDTHNPNAALRSRPLVGVTILNGLRRDGNRWTGRGYSPQEGREFNATATVTGNRMAVRGCVAMFCRTVNWTRVE